MFTHAKPGSIYDRIYKHRMTERSFPDTTSYEALYDFLDKEPTSAFFTTVSLIPDDLACQVRGKLS